MKVQRENMCIYRTRRREWAPGGRAAYPRGRSLLTANKGASTRISILYTPSQRHWTLSRWFGGSAGVQSWWKVLHCFQLLVVLKAYNLLQYFYAWVYIYIYCIYIPVQYSYIVHVRECIEKWYFKVINRETENSVSTNEFYRLFLTKSNELRWYICWKLRIKNLLFLLKLTILKN